MKQRIKLTRTRYTSKATGFTDLYPYVVSQAKLEQDNNYSLETEDALLIGWSTEAEEGIQSTVGIVLLESRQVITVALSSIVFV